MSSLSADQAHGYPDMGLRPDRRTDLCPAHSAPRRALPSILLAGLLLIAVAGCASRQTTTPEAPFDSGLPEVRRVNFSGNEEFSTFALRRTMETRGRPLLQPWGSGEDYEPVILEGDLLRLRKFYFDRGFLETSATVSEVREDADANTVEVDILINEGPETRVRAIDIQGTPPPGLPPKNRILDELPLQPGDRLTREAFDRSAAMLLEDLENLGYANAVVIPDTRVDPETHEASTTFLLEPGVKRAFGRVSIRGAEQVPEPVIEREIRVREGATYSRRAVAESRRNIFDLDMFRAVTPRAKGLDEADKPIDVEFEVQERRPRSLEFSVGVSSIESARFEAVWTHRNIFDEANSLTAAAKISGISQDIEVDLYDPHFFGPNTSADYRVFVLNQKRIWNGIVDIADPFPAYDFLTAGAEWRVEHEFSDRLAGIAGLELSSTDFYNVDLTPEEVLLEGAEDNKLLIQFGEIEWNNRDDQLNPTRGELLRAKLDHSNTGLISDASFAKLELEGRYYRPLSRDTVFATRLRIAGIEPYGGTENVPGNVRFFAGGPGSVRGYRLNRLGPLDSHDDPIGGNSLIDGSVELRYPITGDLGGTAFVDFGNVFAPSFTYRLDDLKYSVGAGLTYTTPVGPVRAEIAYAIDPEDSDLTDLFFFSIGQAF